MKANWQLLAQRIVHGVGVQAGELIQVRDDSGRFVLLMELLLAIEQAGATPLVQMSTAVYMERLWKTATPAYLANWDQHRKGWVQQADRIIALAGAQPDFADVPAAAVQAYGEAEQRITEIEEARQLPYLVVSVPTAGRAKQLDMTLAQLEAHLLPALMVPINSLYREIDRILFAVKGAQQLTIQTGDATLKLILGDRVWHSDDGYIDDQDRARGAIVSNLPAGSIYTTVLESATSGTLRLAQARGAVDVEMGFVNGRVTQINAASGAEQLNVWFDQHSGEPRRVGHIGIGLNPKLHKPIDWTLVDEHLHGSLFISFGENRYMGGKNKSSLNVDFATSNASLFADGKCVIERGKIVC